LGNSLMMIVFNNTMRHWWEHSNVPKNVSFSFHAIVSMRKSLSHNHDVRRRSHYVQGANVVKGNE
jgi:hypothetical protein